MKRKNKIVGELKAYFSKGNVYSFIILKDNKSQNLLNKQRQVFTYFISSLFLLSKCIEELTEDDMPLL